MKSVCPFTRLPKTEFAIMTHDVFRPRSAQPHQSCLRRLFAFSLKLKTPILSPMKPSFVFRLLTASRKACLLAGLTALAASPALAQYADWSANPPKILPNERSGSAVAFTIGSGRQFPNRGAFAALKDDGSVLTWGNQLSGGNSTSVAGSLTSNVTAVYSNSVAFAALKSDGSLVTWGEAFNGGNSSSASGNLSSNVTAVHSTESAFAALKSNGSVVVWGNNYGGGNSTSVAGSLNSNVTAVNSNTRAFAALKSNGLVVTWGDPDFGGNSSISRSYQDSWLNTIYSYGRFEK